MKISVVTISFNQAKYLPECIESVASQEEPFEHIIVDPGSTDGSLDIIANNKSKISHCVLKADEGPADGLNNGFEKATGEIYYYLNADDILMPGVFKQVREYLSRHNSIDVISGAGYIINENGFKTRKIWSDQVSRSGLAHGGSILIQPSTFIRRDAFLKVGGFNKNNRTNWDGELVVDLYLAGASFSIVDKFWSGYRIHRDSITGSASVDEGVRQYGRLRYEKIMGRKPGKFSKIIGQYFRCKRILKHPVILAERLQYGRVYGGRK